ncbi:MAG TPA: hypothetical protein VNC40_09440 [Gaiellaceae bacterium]|nr:hypothetical protein [Gaiellaceae bacterium]
METASIGRAWIVSTIGPAVSAGGVIWAILQPWRVTLLHPRGQGVWWLLVESPLLVVVVGVVFSLVVARPLLNDLEEHDASAG